MPGCYFKGNPTLIANYSRGKQNKSEGEKIVITIGMGSSNWLNL